MSIKNQHQHSPEVILGKIPLTVNLLKITLKKMNCHLHNKIVTGIKYSNQILMNKLNQSIISKFQNQNMLIKGLPKNSQHQNHQQIEIHTFKKERPLLKEKQQLCRILHKEEIEVSILIRLIFTIYHHLKHLIKNL